MKKKLFSWVALSAGMLLTVSSCSEEKSDFGGVDLKTLKLEAPTGDTVFMSTQKFQESANGVFVDMFGSAASECKITGLEYLSSEKGYVASVEFVSPSGQRLNYLVTNTPIKLDVDKEPKIDVSAIGVQTAEGTQKSAAVLHNVSIYPQDAARLEYKNVSGTNRVTLANHKQVGLTIKCNAK